MQKLTNKEEEIMQVLWRLKKAFVKEIIEELPEPKPHYNTVSTLIRKMESKGFIAHEDFGNTYRYLPEISQDFYRSSKVNTTLKNYFDNSYKEMVAHFAKEEKISLEELKEIIKMIETK
ncbi:MAG: BlaI/MecI/CopY family transcriptional regulator [Flavobacteriaceae bacterium]